jgi:hypothetical protein
MSYLSKYHNTKSNKIVCKKHLLVIKRNIRFQLKEDITGFWQFEETPVVRLFNQTLGFIVSIE